MLVIVKIYSFFARLSRANGGRLWVGHWIIHKLNRFMAMREIKRTLLCWLLIIAVPAAVIAGEAQNSFNQGVKLYRAAKYKEAVAAFNRAIKLSPKADEAY